MSKIKEALEGNGDIYRAVRSSSDKDLKEFLETSSLKDILAIVPSLRISCGSVWQKAIVRNYIDSITKDIDSYEVSIANVILANLEGPLTKNELDKI